MNSLETILYRFLWNDKHDKIKRKQMVQNYENGGLKMVYVRCQLETFQSKWVNRLINTEDGTWKITPQFCIDKYVNVFFFFFFFFFLLKMNLGNLRNLQVLSIFYRNMSETWVKHGGGSRDIPKSVVDVRSQEIRGNQLIQHKNKCLFYKHNLCKRSSKSKWRN